MSGYHINALSEPKNALNYISTQNFIPVLCVTIKIYGTKIKDNKKFMPIKVEHFCGRRILHINPPNHGDSCTVEPMGTTQHI